MENEKDLQTAVRPGIVYTPDQSVSEKFSDKAKRFIGETFSLFASHTWQVLSIVLVTALLTTVVVAPLAHLGGVKSALTGQYSQPTDAIDEKQEEDIESFSYVQNGSISITRSDFEVSLDSISRGNFYLNRTDDVNGYAYYIGEYTNDSLDGYSATLGIFCDPVSLETINGFFLYTDSQSLGHLQIIKELLCDVVLCLYDSETALDNYMTLFSSLRLYGIPSEQVIEVLDGLAYAYGVEGNGMTLLIFPAEDALENY